MSRERDAASAGVRGFGLPITNLLCPLCNSHPQSGTTVEALGQLGNDGARYHWNWTCRCGAMVEINANEGAPDGAGGWAWT